MPYLMCPACRLSTDSAAGFPTADRCPRCDGLLIDAELPQGTARRWKVSDLRLRARPGGAENDAS
jgi:Zn-finger nucleic acid-binding protein